ncbi:MAG: hypothetical protein MUE99_02400 [Chitinophagaceae bacterium]|nr:hypothetical protein [Chitinophagaceae bacterium]
MEDVVYYSFRFTLLLIVGLLLIKFVLLRVGRPINYTFFSFFWFSRWQITNSSYDYSKRKRRLQNYLTITILSLILIQLLMFIALVVLYG